MPEVTGWNTRVRHQPDRLVRAESEEDVRRAVAYARARRLPLRAQSTGHGALLPASSGVVVLTNGLARVRIDGDAAEVGAGTTWREVLDATAPYGLAALAPPAPGVGVVGYALGGGAGWLARAYGLCSDSIAAVRIVTRQGRPRWVDEAHEPELFWALRGGMGNFGVVTELRLRLVPVAEVFGGFRYWPLDWAPEVLSEYRTWTANLPPEVTSSVAFVQFPPAPTVPEPVRGRTVIGVRMCSTAVAGGEELVAPWRSLPGALIDTYGRMPFRDVGAITMDSPQALPRIGHSEPLARLTDRLFDRLVELARPGGAFGAVEIRHAGGGVRPPTSHAGIGYWSADYLLFTMAVTPDAAAERAAAAFDLALAEAAAPDRAPYNLMTFLLAPADRVDMAARVRDCFMPAHYARLRKVKAEYDLDDLFGGDRPVPA